MSKYTEETLDKLLKKDLISIVLSQQTQMDAANSEIMDQLCKFNENFEKLQSELIVVKQVNSMLSERLVSMERQCWANAQYSRRECLELVGMPCSVSDGDLEEKVLKIFEKVGCPIEGNNIEACHQISKKNERIIVKFSRRKDCQNVLNAKKELRKLDMKEIGFLEDNPIFVNQSLCTYYRVLWSKAKCLHSLKRISSFYVSGGTVKIKISENSLPLPITHVNDFKEHFPDVSLAPPSESL